MPLRASTSIHSGPSRRTQVLLCVGLALITLAVYAQVGGFEFVSYDDGGYVYENPRVRGGLSLANAVWAFTTRAQANWHPLTWISLMVDGSAAGTSPRVYHLHNLLLHLASTLLLFGLLSRMTGSVWRSAFVAALFAVHPLHVESVAWVSERKDVLSTVFWMLTIWAYVAYVRRPRALTYAAMILLYALGLMAKPMLVSLPIVLLILDYWPLARGRGSGVRGQGPNTQHPAPGPRPLAPGPWPLVREKLPLFALSAASCVVTYWVQRTGGAVALTEAQQFPGRVANAIVSYAAYIVRAFWPSKLAAFYPLPEVGHPEWAVAGGALLLVVVSLAALRARRRLPFLWMGWLWYVVTLAPVAGLVQVGRQSMADRYTYIPLIGLFIAAAWAASELAGARRQRVLAAVAVGIVIALSAAAWRQAGYWRDSFSLARRAIDAVPGNYIGHVNLGLAYSDKGDFPAALDEVVTALAIKPDYEAAHAAFADLLLRRGDTSGALAHLTEAVRLRPGAASNHADLGSLLVKLGRMQDGVRELREALRLSPDLLAARNNLAYALIMLGRTDEAREHISRVLALDPRSADAYVSLGLVEYWKGDLNRAAEHLRRAVQIEPDHAEAHNNLGAVYFRQRRFREAVKEFSWAAELDPKRPDIRQNLAAARAKAGR